MLQHFKNSPLWLIGLFILFAEATAGLAAVRINGWPQAALVIFVISYSTIVTAIFFSFLWFKPENFYGPAEYGDISPGEYARALKGLPKDMAIAVSRFESNPYDNDALYSLMDSLLDEEAKQHLIFMRKAGNQLDISNPDNHGFTHRYELITRNHGIAMGSFDPNGFIRKLSGTDLISLAGGRDKILLSQRGRGFADWLIEHEKDAETFKSGKGGWGKAQSVADVMKERFGQNDL